MRGSRSRSHRIAGKQLALRGQLWPGVKDDDLWMRQKSDGFTTIPRGMPLILEIMNDLSKGQPVSSTYLELWCRAFDECFVTLSKHTEMAFHAGFVGQRAARTWMQRMKQLHELGFIDVKPGPSGPMSYALILNPYRVIRRLYEQKMPGITAEKYNALMQRTIEIGAAELTDPLPDLPALHTVPKTVEDDDEIPF